MFGKHEESFSEERYISISTLVSHESTPMSRESKKYFHCKKIGYTADLRIIMLMGRRLLLLQMDEQLKKK